MSYLLVTYDISNDKLRTKFSKFLKKFGHRLQYSVFEIRNSDRILTNIQIGIRTHFEKKFDQGDSVIIFDLGARCTRINFGYAANDETDLLMI